MKTFGLMLLLLILAGCSGQQIDAVKNVQAAGHVDGDEPALSHPNQDVAVVDTVAQPDAEPAVDTTNSFTLPDTGQDTCYGNGNEIPCGSAFTGQDAEYAGNQPAYSNNGDGTVTDLNTGLMWQQDPGEKQRYYDAVQKNFGLAGYDDWRVPTIKELYTLIDFRGQDPSSLTGSDALMPFINNNYFVFAYGDESDGSRIIDSQWITSSIYSATVMNNHECFFGVNFADGRIKCYPTENDRNAGYYLIHVRNVFPDNDFVDQGETILDATTGLTWQKEDSGYGMDWEDALAFCTDDWRLPNAKELQNIVDYTKRATEPAIDPIFSISHITNEAGEKDYPYFWTSTTHASSEGGKNAAYIGFGKCLGYMNGKWITVHGNGCQRSDPKEGSADDYPEGHGPQGDAIRINNYVRCVKGGATKEEVAQEPLEEIRVSSSSGNAQTPEAPTRTPPQEAIDACGSEGGTCSFRMPQGTITGTCINIQGIVACVP